MPTKHLSQLPDLRDTPLYGEVREFYTALHAPGGNRITDAAEIDPARDGRIAFTGTIFSDLASAPRTRIGVLSPGRSLTVLPNVSGNDRVPKFSPDGQWLAYLSDRGSAGNFQLFLNRLDGSAPEAAATVDGVIESLEWSRDGSSLLLGVAGYGADIAGAQGGATVAKAKKETPDWSPRIDTGDADNLWRSAYVLEVGAGRLRRVSPRGLNIWECTWIDADEIAAVVSDSHSEGSWYTARLVALGTRRDSMRDLYRSERQIGCPAASPDGRHLAFIEAVCSDRLIVCGDLLVLEAKGGAVRRLESGTEVTHAQWLNAETLGYVGTRGIETVLGKMGLRGEPREWWASSEETFGTWYPSLKLDAEGRALAVAESYAIPPHIARFDASGAKEILYSFASEATARHDFNRARMEPVSWKARDGLEIQGLLVRPPGDGSMPLVMDIHGGPVWCCRNRWQGRLRGAKVLADHGIASLYPNPRGSSGRGAEFALHVKGDMGGEDTYDYLTGVEALVERGIADPKRLGVTGISYGGFMSAWLITQDARFAAAAPISCVADWYSQHRTSQIPYFDALFLDGKPADATGLFFARSPAFFAQRVRTPVLQLTGALDQNTPPTQALEFHRSLLEHGVKSVLATYPTAGHGIRTFPEVLDATTRYVSWFLEHFGAV